MTDKTREQTDWQTGRAQTENHTKRQMKAKTDKQTQTVSIIFAPGAREWGVRREKSGRERGEYIPCF